MPDPLQADVIVPVYRDTGMTVRCLESVLAHSGPCFGRLSWWMTTRPSLTWP